MSAMHVNAGGAELLDSRGRAFAADSGFTGGSAVQVASYDVARTTNDVLFYSQREGSAFSFAQSVDNGKYSLFLEFADASSTAAGQRVFDVSVEGQPKLTSYDIFASVGQGAADARCVDVAISDGQLNVAFQASAGLASVSALVLVPTDAPAFAQPYGWDGLDETGRTITSQSNLVRLGQALFLYANDHRGNLPRDFATLQDGLGDEMPHWNFASPRTDTVLPRGELVDVERVAWVAARNDLNYIYYPRLNSSVNETTPMAYENPNRVNDGINVLFGDGHVGHLSRSAAASLIGFPDAPPTDPPVRPVVGPTDPKITTSRSNLVKIGQALQFWANDHSGRYPSDLGRIVDYTSTGPGVQTFINPRSETEPPPANWTLDQRRVWAAMQGDYLYLGDGRSQWRLSPYDIVAFERPAAFTDGINVMFGDGRVEFREIGWFNETLAHQLAPTSNPPWMSSSSGSYMFDGQSLVINSGTVVLSGDIAPLNPNVNVTVAQGATLIINSNEHFASLVVNGTVRLPADFTGLVRTLRTGSLSIGPSGQLDVQDNYLIVDYATTSPRAMIQSAINLARGPAGDWSGATGLTTHAPYFLGTRTLGVLEASEFRSIYPINPHYNGEPIAGNSVLVKFTFYGDTDFNGVVNFDDYSRIDSGFNNGRTGWLNGDFDGNGIVDFDDYSLIDLAFNTQTTVLRPASGRANAGLGKARPLTT